MMKLPSHWPVKPEGSRWTDEQWAAIVADGSNLLIAAAAGSGKTAVLVERIIKRIADESRPLDVDAMLVATFTKAAAAEMKERIRHALEEALEKDAESRHLRRQLALLPRASVTTLHSFCMEIVERYAPLIDLDPGFRLANVTESELLRIDTLDELFEERYEQEGEQGALARLADQFGGERSDEPLHKLVLELHEFAGSHPWPEAWLKEMAEQFQGADADKLLESLWVRSLLGDTILQVDGILNMMRTALHIAQEPDGPAPYFETIQIELVGLEHLSETLRAGGWEQWQQAVANIAFGRLKPCKGDDYNAALIERVKGLRDAVKKAVSKLSEEWLVRSPEQYVAELNVLAPDMEQLAELTITFGQRYEQAKRAKGLLDFSDLEHYTLRILRDPSSTPEHSEPSAAARSFRNRFAEIYLDEYQDTNEVQEAIVSLIARREPGNVFMVGDVKQSIYRFRLAEPGLFMGKYRTYDLLNEELSSQEAHNVDGVRIDLARNFRSRREILYAVNHLFRLIMREPVGEMDYDDRAQLIYGEGYPDAGEPNPYAIEMILLDGSDATKDVGQEGATAAMQNDADESGSSEDERQDTEDVEAAQLEARCVAAEIRKLMGHSEDGAVPFSVYDGKSKLYRPVQYRDIVILLRAVSSLAPVFLDELKAAGIPAYADLATGYFAATEVDVMLSLLSIIDNPHQDIPLAGVLRSPIVGFTAEHLAQVRLKDRKGSFWEAVIATAEEEVGVDDSLSLQLKRFVLKLNEWRDYARREPLGELLWMLYRETGYYDYVGGLPGGGQRQANLRALVNRATQYEQSSRFRGLFRFLRFLGRMRDTGADLGAARALGESENVVRIISIHRSKGLEFPVVFAASLGKGFNKQDLNSRFLKHKKLGFGPTMVELDTRITYPTLPQLAIRRKLAAEMLAEEMRVLYVALTRPKEKLFLIGTSKDAAKQWEKWEETAAMVSSEGLPKHAVASANRYLDWLGPAAMIAMHDADPTRKWHCRVVSSSTYMKQSTSEQATDSNADERWSAVIQGEAVVHSAEDAEVASSGEQIAQILAWSYPNQAATEVAAKTSITALKQQREGQQQWFTPEATERDEEEHRWLEEGIAEIGQSDDAVQQHATFRLRRPRFMSAKKLTGAERGSAYHLVMQHLPIQAGTDSVRVVALIDTLVDRHILSSEQREAIDAREIATFCQTNLYKRMCSATRIWREVPFTYGLTAKAVYPGINDSAEHETIIIQGVIDCLFEDDEGLVLIDYKTDSLAMQSADEAAEKHRFQIKQYSEAVGHIVNRPVDMAFVYFFDGGQVVRLS
ncbi:MAG: helicase-exonuclease AddAB subunit AddA [Candidatus Cohnella colombiensis]|uniref:ATP-dependent helicase/nuclease subunit A n=1 Tax=Candidatus Cohnella colombiensis TaxID=3121368 RepID=A0AA95JEW8_9BACL|nr:MAG: helicase-exonuclease AddAB subunit AddA [Cohnella sp.]